jgi:putative hydrolases of HD superfamily
MYRMSIMCFLMKDVPHIDYSKCIRMALVHDLAESIIGDISPECGIPRIEKLEREEVLSQLIEI